MTPQLMVRPSSLIGSGLRMEQVDSNLSFFKFTDELQSRLEELLEKHKAGLVTPDEEAELAGISDLSQIFTFINSRLAAQAKWSPTEPEDLYNDEQDSYVNTATPQNK
ncbi:hypothetical protein [Allocoleopsis sp.]|uniref:hypothetical protein n=1 Tax=Allocoleopsis sp. TaxID=3088169 RepID=UPI002FD50BE5